MITIFFVFCKITRVSATSKLGWPCCIVLYCIVVYNARANYIASLPRGVGAR